jgi:acetyl esterase/lipase
MKSLIKIIFSLFVSNMCFAQNDSIPIWPNAVPGTSVPKSKPVHRILEDGSVRVMEVTDPHIAVFEPIEYKHNGKAVLIMPGGGYVRVATIKEGYSTAMWLRDQGYTAFVLEYRVPDKRDGARQDVERAMRLIRKNAKKYRVDPNKIAAMGFSAGAHLAALSGMADEITYPLQDSSDIVSARPNAMIIIYPGYLDGGPDRSISPNLKPTKETVPTFIYQTMDDRSAPSSFALAQALQKVGAKVELHMLPEGGHGYGMYPVLRAAEAWPKLLMEWLKVYF